MSKPIILLFPGAWSDHCIFQPQIDYFAARYEYIAPNIHQFDSIQKMSDYVVETYAQQNVVALLGLSMGGYIVLDLLVRYPEFCQKAVVIGSSAEPLSADAKPFIKSIRNQIAAGTSLHDFLEPYIASVLIPQNQNDLALQAVIKQMFNQLGNEACVNHHDACLAWQGYSTAELQSVKAEVLVMAGEEDTALPQSEVRAIAATIPGARFVVIPAAAHFATLEAPAVVNATLAELLLGNGAAN